MPRLLWIVFIFLSVSIGLYPAMYLALDMSGGLLASKPREVVESVTWLTAFYLHIGLGGLSLLVGWSQFSRKLRTRNLNIHRTLGKIYLVCVMISGLCGLYIAFFATGGWISSIGFA